MRAGASNCIQLHPNLSPFWKGNSLKGEQKAMDAVDAVVATKFFAVNNNTTASKLFGEQGRGGFSIEILRALHVMDALVDAVGGWPWISVFLLVTLIFWNCM